MAEGSCEPEERSEASAKGGKIPAKSREEPIAESLEQRTSGSMSHVTSSHVASSPLQPVDEPRPPQFLRTRRGQPTSQAQLAAASLRSDCASSSLRIRPGQSVVLHRQGKGFPRWATSAPVSREHAEYFRPPVLSPAFLRASQGGAVMASANRERRQQTRESAARQAHSSARDSSDARSVKPSALAVQHSPDEVPRAGERVAYGPSVDISHLPDVILTQILERVSARTGGHTSALVCKAWATVSASAQVSVSTKAGCWLDERALVRNLSSFSSLSGLHLEQGSVHRLTDTFLEGLGERVLGPGQGLKALSIERGAAVADCTVSAQGFSALFSGCTALRSLRFMCLSSGPVDLPDNVSGLKALRTLVFAPVESTMRPWLQSSQRVRPLSTSLISLSSLRHLHFASTLVNHIPEAFSALTNLKSLVLQCTTVEELPEGTFKGMHALTHLHLSCRLRTLPACLFDLPRLASLELENMALARLGDEIGQLATLRRLVLHAWNLSALPGSIPALRSLSLLHVHARLLQALPPNLGLMPSLQDLHIDCRSLRVLPHGLCRSTPAPGPRWWQWVRGRLHSTPGLFSGLSKLCLVLERNSQLEVDALCRLPALGSLSLSFRNDLTVWPVGIELLSVLHTLKFGVADAMTSLPLSLGKITSLKVLHIRGPVCGRGGIRSLPHSLGALASLQELALMHCPDLSELPSTFHCLSKLASLSLVSCHALLGLPEVLAPLTSLQHIRIRDCENLLELPGGSLGQLAGLSTLVLDKVRALMWVPRSIGCLSSLQNLTIRGSINICSLPDSLTELSALVEIKLEHCPMLAALPAEIGQLAGLRVLRLVDLPALTQLPVTLHELSGLRELAIEGCSLSSLPPELLHLPMLTSQARHKLAGLARSFRKPQGRKASP